MMMTMMTTDKAPWRCCRSRRQHACTVAALLLVMLACSDAASVASPATIEIAVTPASATVSVGQTRQLSAEVRNADGEPMEHTVFWSSSDTTVAVVNSDGIVTARKAGEAQIAATAQGVSATALVRVSAPGSTFKVTHVWVSPVTAVVKANGPQAYRRVQLTATALDDRQQAITGRAVQWKSSKSSTASVNADGLVTGQAPGTVTITATIDGVSGTASIVVVR